MSPSKILFFMSGSIAGFKACQVISALVKEGHDVQVVATPSTFQFVGAATLEGLTGKKVLSDLWERGHAMDHIHLSRWADCGVLCPASANTIAKLAGGFADDLVSALALAWPAGKPFTVIPAMNHQMLAAPVTQASLAALNSRGFTIASTQSGALACGEEGEGRMLEPDSILRLLFKPDLGRLLITGGATREPVDGIRYLSNVSTGQTAAALASDLSGRGWRVTYLHGAGAVKAPQSDRQIEFSSFADLDEKLRTELARADYTGIVHAAAVSDYSVAGARPEIKLNSDLDLRLELKRNFKILPRLKEYSRAKNAVVVGFKLTLGESEASTAAAARKALGPAVDAVVANEWGAVDGDRTRHPATFVQTNSMEKFTDLPSLGARLHALFQGVQHDSLS